MPELEPEIRATLRRPPARSIEPPVLMTMSRQICDLELIRGSLRTMKWAIAVMLACNLGLLALLLCR